MTALQASLQNILNAMYTSPLFWAIVGAAFSVALQVLYEFLRQLRTPSRVFGDWHATWQPTVVTGWDWVSEIVTIRRSFGRIRVSNKDNDQGFQSTGEARFVGGKYLIGEWRSIRPGSNEEGIFALTFSVDGKALIGVFLTQDRDAEKIATPFVLGRSLEEMERAREKLKRLLRFGFSRN